MWDEFANGRFSFTHDAIITNRPVWYLIIDKQVFVLGETEEMYIAFRQIRVNGSAYRNIEIEFFLKKKVDNSLSVYNCIARRNNQPTASFKIYGNT